MQILVAEDDLVIQLCTRRVLERHGHSVVVVGDGRPAVDSAKRRRYDVILMDIQMPIMDGLMAAAAIR